MSVLRDTNYSVSYNQYIFFSGHSQGGDILVFKGSKATFNDLPFVKFSDLIYSAHLPKIVR